MKLPIEILDEIFRFTQIPQFVLYFHRVLSRQTILCLFKKKPKPIQIGFLYEYKFDIDSQICKGNLQTVKILRKRLGAKCTTDTMDNASRNGFLEVVKYLHETVGVTCTIDAMDSASSNGFLEVVKYLHETVGAKCTTNAMDFASMYGFLDVVKYLENI